MPKTKQSWTILLRYSWRQKPRITLAPLPIYNLRSCSFTATGKLQKAEALFPKALKNHLPFELAGFRWLATAAFHKWITSSGTCRPANRNSFFSHRHSDRLTSKYIYMLHPEYLQGQNSIHSQRFFPMWSVNSLKGLCRNPNTPDHFALSFHEPARASFSMRPQVICCSFAHGPSGPYVCCWHRVGTFLVRTF